MQYEVSKKNLAFDFSNWRLIPQSATTVNYSDLLQNVKHIILFFYLPWQLSAQDKLGHVFQIYPM